MFWNKKKELAKVSMEQPFLKECWLFVSPELEEILLVPTIKSINVRYGLFTVEQDDVIVKSWPSDLEYIGQLTLDCFNNCIPTNEDINDFDNWPSLNNSKAKSQQQFKVEYIWIRVYQRADNLDYCDLIAYPYHFDVAEFHLVTGSALSKESLGDAIASLIKGCQKIRK
jgi:hypothetical protein